MNITLDIKCPELAQAINNLAAAMSIRAVGNELASVPEKEDRHDPRHVGQALAGKPKTPKVKAEPEAVTVESEGEPAEVAVAVDYTRVKAAVMKVSQEKGRQAAVDLLAEFDAKVGGDLAEEQWGPFLARAEEVLG